MLNVYLTNLKGMEITQEDWERTPRKTGRGQPGRKGAMQRSSAQCGLSQQWNSRLFESLPVAQHHKLNLSTGNWKVTVKTYHSDLMWFYNGLLWFKKATECLRQTKMRLKLFKSGADCREWLTKAPLMLPYLARMIPITLCAAVCLLTSRVKLCLALQIDCAFPVPYTVFDST